VEWLGGLSIEIDGSKASAQRVNARVPIAGLLPWNWQPIETPRAAA
jgi:hypothetical protein